MKNTISQLKWHLMCLLIVPAMISCSEDDDSDDDGETPGNFGYIFSMRTQGADGTSDYVWKLDSLEQLISGELSVEGVGIEQAGWNYYFGLNNSFFSINYGDEGTIAYGLNASGNIQQTGNFYADRLDCMGVADEENMIGIGAPWGGGSYDCEFMVINAESKSITSRKFNSMSIQHGDLKLNLWPTGAVVRDSKIYVPYYPVVGDTWETPLMDTAYIGVYEYPSLDYVTTLKDDRAAPIGMYGSQPCISATEDGDIYTFSTGSYASGYTRTGSPSGILRIKNGENDFDTDYFINFEESAVAGRIVFGNYLGDGKALVRYIPVETDDELKTVWAATDDLAYLFKMAIVDLESKTVTPINGIPVHGGGWSRGAFLEDGIAYHDIVTATEVRMYAIDIEEATAVKGALIHGATVPLVYKIEY
ncbi:MAG: DUF4374 domain-containing protein [Prolixibacteraceae bacterium]